VILLVSWSALFDYDGFKVAVGLTFETGEDRFKILNTVGTAGGDNDGEHFIYINLDGTNFKRTPSEMYLLRILPRYLRSLAWDIWGNVQKPSDE